MAELYGIGPNIGLMDDCIKTEHAWWKLQQRICNRGKLQLVVLSMCFRILFIQDENDTSYFQTLYHDTIVVVYVS